MTDVESNQSRKVQGGCQNLPVARLQHGTDESGYNFSCGPRGIGKVTQAAPAHRRIFRVFRMPHTAGMAVDLQADRHGTAALQNGHACGSVPLIQSAARTVRCLWGILWGKTAVKIAVR